MNTNTGELYRLLEPEHQALIDGDVDKLREEYAERQSQDVGRLLSALERGEPVVPVSEAVVQKVELGNREQRRRAARRRKR